MADRQGAAPTKALIKTEGTKSGTTEGAFTSVKHTVTSFRCGLGVDKVALL